jgi:hypothetical protein
MARECSAVVTHDFAAGPIDPISPSSFFSRDSSMAFMKLFQLSPLHVDVAFKKVPVHAPPDLVPEEGSLPSLANA